MNRCVRCGKNHPPQCGCADQQDEVHTSCRQAALLFDRMLFHMVERGDEDGEKLVAAGKAAVLKIQAHELERASQ